MSMMVVQIGNAMRRRSTGVAILSTTLSRMAARTGLVSWLRRVVVAVQSGPTIIVVEEGGSSIML
jgi:hypothetical protein